jgi:hypothetical protein
MLEKGDPIPHFTVTTMSGELFEYARVWQRKNLVLITAAGVDLDSVGRFVSDLANRISEFNDLETEFVVTRDHVAGIRERSVVVADRWGEIVHLDARSAVAGLPGVQDLLDWIAHVQARCPECEGEAR